MKGVRNANRRTVLKTIGASVIGSAVLTGSATANDRSDKETIIMQAHQFQPRGAKVRLGGEGESTTVTWINRDDVNYYGYDDPPVPHQVHVHGHGEGGVSSALDSVNGQLAMALLPGGSYVVEFEEDVDAEELILTEVKDESTKLSEDASDPAPAETARIPFDGSVELHMHCIIHTHDEPGPFGKMEGTLKVSR